MATHEHATASSRFDLEYLKFPPSLCLLRDTGALQDGPALPPASEGFAPCCRLPTSLRGFLLIYDNTNAPPLALYCVLSTSRLLRRAQIVYEGHKRRGDEAGGCEHIERRGRNTTKGEGPKVLQCQKFAAAGSRAPPHPGPLVLKNKQQGAKRRGSSRLLSCFGPRNLQSSAL